MIDDGNPSGVSVSQDQVGNTDKAVAADVQFKFVFNGQNIILISKTIEGFEVLQAFFIILTGKPTWKRREVFLDGFIVLCGIEVGQFKGHQFALRPAFKDAVAMSAVGGVGILYLRHFINVLQFECQRALIVEGLLAERPFHFFGY